MASLRRLLVGTLLLAACGSDGTANTEPGSAPVHECDGPPGSWTNLSSEPIGFRDDPSARVNWTEGGCAVNLNFIFHRYGDEHCDTEDVEFISIGVPIGTPYTGPEATPPGQDWEPLFFHNTGNAYDWLPPAVVLDELPADAVDTGLRAAGARELHVAPDENELYVVNDGDVHVFPVVSEEETNCA